MNHKMKIAIISDTHGNVANFRKAVDWLSKENIRIILHCGDIGSPESLKESLADFKGEFFGVFGNMDKDFKLELQEYQNSPKVKVFESIGEIELDNKKIAFTHFPDIAKKLAQSGKYDLVFYGHTHRPWDELVLSGAEGKKCHMINPGELAGQFYKPTFAVYDTTTGNLELKILEKL